MTAEKPAREPLSRPTAALLVVVAVALLAGAWLLVAAASYERSFSAGDLGERAARADVASAMAPWSAGYANRALVLDSWKLGSDLLAAGDYAGAIDALDVAYRHDIGDQELLALYRRAQETQAEATNRKAHLQHGHEGPGGTLAPSQVER